MRSKIIGHIEQESTHEKPSHWRDALPVAVTVGLLSVVSVSYLLDELTISKHEAQDAIYAEYGECLAGTHYALGRVATEYSNDVAQVTPVDIPADALVFDMPLGISGQPLPHPNDATELRLAGIGCETQKSLGQLATGG